MIVILSALSPLHLSAHVVGKSVFTSLSGQLQTVLYYVVVCTKGFYNWAICVPALAIRHPPWCSLGATRLLTRSLPVFVLTVLSHAHMRSLYPVVLSPFDDIVRDLLAPYP